MFGHARRSRSRSPRGTRWQPQQATSAAPYRLVSLRELPAGLRRPPTKAVLDERAAAFGVPPDRVRRLWTILVHNTRAGEDYCQWAASNYEYGIHLKPVLIGTIRLERKFGTGANQACLTSLFRNGHPCLQHVEPLWFFVPN